MKKIEISDELYEAIQNLKNVFSNMSGKKVEDDEAVIGILVSGFIDSLKGEGDDRNLVETGDIMD